MNTSIDKNYLNSDFGNNQVKAYDVSFIGAGISTSFSILGLINQLEKQPPVKPVRVAVIDQSGEFWTGIPYGRRSGTRSLIITSIREFLPEDERERFISWLRLNWHEAVASRDGSGESTQQWNNNNQCAIDEGAWDELFVPRFTFGMYLKDRVAAQLAYASNARLMTCRCISGAVQHLTREGTQFTLRVHDNASGDVNPIYASKVVLALGSPPNRGASQFRPPTDATDDFRYIDDMYEPAHEMNLLRIAESLGNGSPHSLHKILIIGSNASALESIYTILDRPDISDRVSKMVVLSPSGEFPHKISRTTALPRFRANHLSALADRTDFIAGDILRAVEKDLVNAHNLGIPVADTFPIISKGVLSALNRLNGEEQKNFVVKYGVAIGKLQRRAGRDYSEAMENL